MVLKVNNEDGYTPLKMTALFSVLAIYSHVPYSEDYNQVVELDTSKSFFGSSYSIYETVENLDSDHYVIGGKPFPKMESCFIVEFQITPHRKDGLINDEIIFYVRTYIHPSGYNSHFRLRQSLRIWKFQMALLHICGA